MTVINPESTPSHAGFILSGQGENRKTYLSKDNYSSRQPLAGAGEKMTRTSSKFVWCPIHKQKKPQAVCQKTSQDPKSPCWGCTAWWGIKKS
jgi:hypothetical protein